MCMSGGWCTEQRGSIPSGDETMRSIMKLSLQTWETVPDDARYELMAEEFNRKVVRPALCQGMHTVMPFLREVSGPEVETHMKRHMTVPDREVLSVHCKNLDTLARHVWERELMVEDEHGNVSFDSKEAKFYVDVVKALQATLTVKRSWRAEDRVECESVVENTHEETEGRMLVSAARKRMRVDAIDYM